MITVAVGLDLGGLPDLPQCAFLRELATDLWAAPEVAAVWVGGSLACGKGDADSDVDLRVAVASEAFDPAALPPGAQRAAERAVIHLAFPWGEGVVLHHLMLDDGAIYDLLVQSAAVEPCAETRLILGCRDAALAAKLAEPSADPPPTAFPAPTAREVREILRSTSASTSKCCGAGWLSSPGRGSIGCGRIWCACGLSALPAATAVRFSA